MWWKRGEMEADAAVPRQRRSRIIGTGHFPQLVVLLLLGPTAPASAQNQGLVVRDGSLGSGPPGIVAPGIDDLGQPAHYLIRADLGEQRGGNLFHSFSRFSIGQGEVATFTGPDPVDGPQSVHHLVSRVTADNPSEIDGTLRSTIPGADFYLLNPAGVMFGPEAALDVPGALHFGTSADLEFTTGERFEASADGSVPVLGIAEPSTFGFLGDHAGPISLDGSAFESLRGLSLAGGSISFEAARVSTEPGAGGSGAISLLARDEITLAGRTAEDSGARIETVTSSPEPAGAIRMEAPVIVLEDGAAILSESSGSAGGAGSITVTTGELSLEGGAAIQSNTSGDGDAGDIVIEALEEVALSAGSSLISVTLGSGDAGSIRATVPVLRLEDGAVFGNSTSDTGDAGDVVIEAFEDVVLSRSGIISLNEGGSGNAGSVLVMAPRVHLKDRAIVDASSFGSGAGGNVRMEVGELRVTGGSSIEAKDVGEGSTGGDVVIAATKGVTISGFQFDLVDGSLKAVQSAIRATSRAQGGGSITVTTPVLRLEDGALINARTHGASNAGDISIVASKEVVFSGFSPEGESAILADTLETATGNGGSVLVMAPRVRFADGGTIRTTTAGEGDAGDIVVVATEGLSLSGAASSLVAAANKGSRGDAGAITVTTPVLLLEDGATIASATLGTGDGGDVVVEASQEVVLSGSVALITALTAESGHAGSVLVKAPKVRLGDTASLFSGTFGSGKGGEVQIVTSILEITNASISADSFVSGDAGSVRVTADEVRLADGGAITTTTLSTGDAGDIVVVATKGVSLSGADANGGRSRLSAAATEDSKGDAGAITVTTPVLLLEDGAAITSFSQGTGDAGDIVVDASEEVVLTNVDGGSFITNINSLTAGTGDGGSVLVKAPRVRLGDGASFFSGTLGSRKGGDVEVATSLLEMTNGASISAESTGSGDAGSVRVTADELLAEDGSQISVAATSANGGDVVLAVRDRVHLVDSAISADVGEGAGGNILIDPTFVILDHSEIVARAGEGTGGEITIVADALIKDPESLISASAGNPSLSGTVNVNAPDVDLAASLAQLSDSALDASDAITPPCSARRRGETPGSFVFSGRQGVPPGPEGALAAWPGQVPSGATGAVGAGSMLAHACR